MDIPKYILNHEAAVDFYDVIPGASDGQVFQHQAKA
jgi:hypothetical protein